MPWPLFHHHFGPLVTLGRKRSLTVVNRYGSVFFIHLNSYVRRFFDISHLARSILFEEINFACNGKGVLNVFSKLYRQFSFGSWNAFRFDESVHVIVFVIGGKLMIVKLELGKILGESTCSFLRTISCTSIRYLMPITFRCDIPSNTIDILLTIFDIITS